MPQFCAIIGCGASSKKDKDCSFYRFPSEKDNRSRINEQAVRRRKAWILSLKRNDLTEQKLKNERVCSRHFILGKPAALTDEGNPDWIPSQKMGYKKHTSQNAMKRYERLKNRAQVCCSVAEMEDRDIKLIALVKQYPYLYDRGDTNFKNKPLIEKSWRVIASHMKTSSEDCQRRWCVLRNRYAKEKRENNILDPNRREWSLMKSFDFLDVHVKTRKSFNKPTSPQNEIYLEEHPATKVGKWEEIIIDEVKIDHNSTEKMCRNFLYSDQSDSSFRNDDESNRCKSAIVVPQLENILEKRNPDSLGNSFCEVANNKNVSFDTESATSEDSTMHFCLSLHEPLSKIPTKFITKAKIEILQVLDKYENA